VPSVFVQVTVPARVPVISTFGPNSTRLLWFVTSSFTVRSVATCEAVPANVRFAAGEVTVTTPLSASTETVPVWAGKRDEREVADRWAVVREVVERPRDVAHDAGRRRLVSVNVCVPCVGPVTSTIVTRETASGRPCSGRLGRRCAERALDARDDHAARLRVRWAPST